MKRKLIPVILSSSLLMQLLTGCQAELKDLTPPPQSASASVSPAADATAQPDSIFSSGSALYDHPATQEDFYNKINGNMPVCITQLALYDLGKGFLDQYYAPTYARGPVSWQDSSYESVTLSDDEMQGVELLSEQFVYAVDDMQIPEFITPGSMGTWKAGAYTSQQIRAMQQAWQQQIMTESLYRGLADSGQEISWVTGLFEDGIGMQFLYMIIASDNTVYQAAGDGQTTRYAVPVMLVHINYTTVNNDGNFNYVTLRDYLARHPERRLQWGGGSGNLFHWLFMEKDADGRLAITGWEDRVINSGVADAVIYSDQGVRTIWHDRSDGMLDGYTMQTLDYRNEEELTRQLYQAGTEFVTAMATLKGADTADRDFDAARAMMSPELRESGAQVSFFTEYLKNIKAQDIHMTPYFAPDPMDERLSPAVDLYTEQPLVSLAKLTRDGMPDLYQILFKWNYTDYSSNVDYVGAVNAWGLFGTMDLSGNDTLQDDDWKDELRTGHGYTAAVTFIKRDGALQVVSWEMMGS